VVDVWSWQARLRVACGQTITDVIAKIHALESSLGTFRGAARVYPTPDELANRCDLRVLDVDSHAGAAPRGPTGLSAPSLASCASSMSRPMPVCIASTGCATGMFKVSAARQASLPGVAELSSATACAGVRFASLSIAVSLSLFGAPSR